jgi:cytochrome c oxidase subunit 3
MSDHGHGHNPNLAHHFDSMDQQNNAGKLGMWLFLATEVLLFAGLFCAYAVYRANHPEVFEYASTFLDVRWGALNTVVLLASSWTRSAQLGERNKTSMFLVLTLLGAGMFMGIKAIEYSSKFSHGTLWGIKYQPQDPKEAEFTGSAAAHGDEAAGEQAGGVKLDAATQALLDDQSNTRARTPWDGEALLASNASSIDPPPPGEAGLTPEGEEPTIPADKVENVYMFFGIYFILTGTHGLHVIFGALAILWVLRRNIRGDFDKTYNLPVDLVGLYWHIVDLIWIYLFPLLYLINVTEQGTYGLH